MAYSRRILLAGLLAPVFMLAAQRLPAVPLTGSAQATPPPAAATASPATDKETLELEKLREEIQNERVNLILQSGTLLAAFAATAISFWSAWKSSRSQIESLQEQARQHEKAHISQLLGELGSPQAAVRLSAIQSLGEYESSTAYLVGLLQVEEDNKVSAAVITVLKRRPEVAMPLLVQASRELFTQQQRWVVELHCLGCDNEMLSQTFEMPRQQINELITANLARRVRQASELKIRALGAAQETPPAHIQAAERERIFSAWAQAVLARNRVVDAIEKVAGHAARAELVCSLRRAVLPGIVLDGLQMSGWDFSGAELTDASFKDAVLDGADFSEVQAARADFRGASLGDTRFEGAQLDDVKFNTAKISGASFKQASGKKVRFFGAVIKVSFFTECHFDQAQFTRAVLLKSSFNQSQFNGAKLTHCVINDCDFGGANLLGADFSASIAHRSAFNQANFAGNVFNGCDFLGSTFISAQIKAVSACEDICLIETNWEGAQFGAGSEALTAELARQRALDATSDGRLAR